MSQIKLVNYALWWPLFYCEKNIESEFSINFLFCSSDMTENLIEPFCCFEKSYSNSILYTSLYPPLFLWIPLNLRVEFLFFVMNNLSILINLKIEFLILLSHSNQRKKNKRKIANFSIFLLCDQVSFSGWTRLDVCFSTPLSVALSWRLKQSNRLLAKRSLCTLIRLKSCLRSHVSVCLCTHSSVWIVFVQCHCLCVSDCEP